MELNQIIAQKLTRQKLKDSLRSSDLPIKSANYRKKSLNESADYQKQVQSYLNYHLGSHESGVTVDKISVISETPSTITLKVDYAVDIQIPMYDPEDQRTYYEQDTDYRSETLTFDLDELKDSSLEEATAEELQKKFAAYQQKQGAVNKQLDKTQKKAMSIFQKSKQMKEDATPQADSHEGWEYAEQTSDNDPAMYWKEYNGLYITIYPPQEFGQETYDRYEVHISDATREDQIEAMQIGLKSFASAESWIQSWLSDNGYLLESEDMDQEYADASLNEDELSMDDDPEETEQKYDSAKTSINSSKLPVLFKMVQFAKGSLNLDYGGGKFDNVAAYLDQTYGATNLVYDKYNRTSEHNRAVLTKVREHGGADTVTCSNVLNVIAEEAERLAVLRNCKRFLKSGGTCYITVYEGNGSGEGKPSSSGYQLNRKTADYESEISSVFSSVTRKGKLWICS